MEFMHYFHEEAMIVINQVLDPETTVVLALTNPFPCQETL